jgi:hypothetical protein
MLRYADRYRVKFIVATANGLPAALRLFPDSSLLARTDSFFLYSRNSEAPLDQE